MVQLDLIGEVVVETNKEGRRFVEECGGIRVRRHQLGGRISVIWDGISQ